MKKQKIKIGEKEFVVQDISTKDKLILQQTMVDGYGGIHLVEAMEYILNFVIVVPQGLIIDDFKFDEIQVLFEFVKEFLGLEGKQIKIELIE